MEKLFKRKRLTSSPVTGSEDRVVPLHFFEDSLLVQGNNMAVSLVFDDVLDPEMLRSSLEGLVKRDGWQRLGGRLRKNVRKIEWHIPREFTPSRPAIHFTHVDHCIPASQHPVASKIPEPSIRPSVVSDPDLLEDLVWEPGRRPNGIKDYLNTDLPVLGLKVHSFTDRTIVVLKWQHVAFDALGMQHVVNGWMKVLWGREDEVPTPCGVDKDPFEPLATGARKPTERHLLMDRKVGIWGMLKWGAGYGIDMLVRAKENRMVCVPRSFWEPQLEKALQELRKEAEINGEDPDKVFLTEGDILTAWTMKCVVGSMNMDPNRVVAGSIAMSLRKAFQGDLLPENEKEHPYIGNAFGWGNVLVTASEVMNKPLSWLARQVRRAINEQGTRAQHEAYYDMVRTVGKGLPIIIFGDGGMYQIGFSNWTKAVFIQENHGPVKPVDGFFVIGKDEKGNYWTCAYKVKGQWTKFQDFLNREFSQVSEKA
ncbi:uncharacterized protein CTHT_0003820 [Thermochaetoides thermophila DSM 1495]|uniref:Uncharacterized protein n=1 Tax=Chaetomium thermophilum (strain DSM 1495 / CBS 144.50 / IMI 039719) TaxID=759272 RepID=G0RZQ7_CHATD|nr:hypothetical protein CTHT_0003820 [Thermochaetoides thermophila DSM 1495]EGS23685.1 hypothetical protein CTHT_0003820 [Thermochaetoides thermophila DSM 1495]